MSTWRKTTTYAIIAHIYVSETLNVFRVLHVVLMPIKLNYYFADEEMEVFQGI